MNSTLVILPLLLPLPFFVIIQMSFETRKGMHMLFVALLVTISFHSYAFRFLGSILVVWYALDKFYFITKQ